MLTGRPASWQSASDPVTPTTNESSGRARRRQHRKSDEIEMGVGDGNGSGPVDLRLYDSETP